MLANGAGGIDWAGFDFACEYLGVVDVEGVVCRLNAIRTYKPPKE